MKRFLSTLFIIGLLCFNQTSFAAYPTTTEHHKLYPYTSIMASPYSGDPTGVVNCAPAIESIKANQSNVGTIYIPKGTFLVGTNLTIPSGMSLEFAAGAYLNIAAGVTLTIPGSIIAPDGQNCFTGTGTLSLGTTFPITNTTKILVPGTWSVTSNTTIPSNIVLRPRKGAVLTVSTGVTLTINGTIEAGPYQIFSCIGTGKVVFSAGTSREVYPDWWGVTGTDDDVAINAALIAAPNGGTVTLLGKTYTTSAKITVPIYKNLKGSWYNRGGGSSAVSAGSIIDASGVTGTAIEVAGDSLQGEPLTYLGGFWLKGGAGVTKGIEFLDYNSRWYMENISIWNCSAASDGTGGNYGIYLTDHNFSGTMRNVELYQNDIGLFVPSHSQHLLLDKCKIYHNYTFGADILDAGVITFLNSQLEKNGKIADTTGSVRLRGAQSVSFLGHYNEQDGVFIGAALICQAGVDNGYTENVYIDGGSTFIGNNAATKGIILATCRNFWNFGLISSFTTVGVSYEPSSTVSTLENIHNYNPRYLTRVANSNPNVSIENYLSNPFFQKWWASDNPVGWTKSTRGTFSLSTDAGAINAICAKMVGDGVAGEVSLSQNIMNPGLYFGNAAQGASVWVLAKCPAANAVTSSILVGGYGFNLTKSDSWKWYRTGINVTSWTSLNVRVKLCSSTDTAQATDELYIGYVGLFPGWAFPEGPIGEIDRNLYGSATFDPTPGTQDTITVTGAAVGDAVVVYPPYDTVAASVTGSVTATNTVKVLTLGTDLGSGLWRVKVLKQ